MPTILRHNPDQIGNQVDGRFPLKLIRLCLQELYRVVRDAGLVSGSAGGGSGSGTSGSGGGSSASSDTYVVTWRANGPYRVDTSVDGAWIVTTACTISKLYLWRGTAGRSGQTALDVKRNGASLYATTANRPALLYNDADGMTPCNLPDAVALVPGDAVTVDCLERDTGRPHDYTLTLEAAA